MVLVGTVMAPVLLIAMVVAEATALFSDTVQVELALLPRVDGLQAIEASCTGAASVSVVVCLVAPVLAVMVAV